MVRKFGVTITTYVTIEVSDGILAITDYGTPEQIAAYLAWESAFRNRHVPDIDGYADRSMDEVKVGRIETDTESVEVKS